jgi:hypothetical protein
MSFSSRIVILKNLLLSVFIFKKFHYDILLRYLFSNRRLIIKNLLLFIFI